jgi:hypothetical protein
VPIPLPIFLIATFWPVICAIVGVISHQQTTQGWIPCRPQNTRRHTPPRQ